MGQVDLNEALLPYTEHHFATKTWDELSVWMRVLEKFAEKPAAWLPHPDKPPLSAPGYSGYPPGTDPAMRNLRTKLLAGMALSPPWLCCANPRSQPEEEELALLRASSGELGLSPLAEDARDGPSTPTVAWQAGDQMRGTLAMPAARMLNTRGVRE